MRGLSPLEGMMLPEKEEKDGKSTGKVMERAQRKKGVY